MASFRLPLAAAAVLTAASITACGGGSGTDPVTDDTWRPGPGQGETVLNGVAQGQWKLSGDFGAGSLGAYYPAVAVNKAGTALVAWAEEDSQRRKVMAAIGNVATDTWTAPVEIDLGAGSTLRSSWNYKFYSRGHVQVGMDDSGNGFAVWPRQAETGQPWDVYVTRYEGDTKTWQAPLKIGGGANELHFPDIAMNASGDAVVTWIHKPSTGYAATAVAYYDAELGHWSEAEYLVGETQGTVDRSLVGASQLPRPVINEDGIARVIWSEREVDSSDRVMVASYQPSEGWGEPTKLYQGDSSAVGDAELAESASGDLVAVWTVYDGSDAGMYWSEYGNESWSVPQRREGPNWFGINSSVEFTSNGDLVHAWTDTTGASSHYYYETGATVFSPDTGWGSNREIMGDAGTRPLVAADGYGNALVVSYFVDNAWYAIRTPDGAWSKAAQVGAGYESDLASNGKDVIALANADKDSMTGNWKIQVRVIR